MVICRSRPQTQDVRAVLVEDVSGVHAVAQRLVHGLALAVHGPAVGDTLLEGRTVAEGAHGGQQRGLEPAAVLIEALQVHIGRPEALVPLHGREVGGAGVEPAVQRVGLLLEAALAAAVGAGHTGGQEIDGVLVEPGVGAFLAEHLGNSGDGLVGHHGLAAVLAVHHRNGQTPTALAGNAPVGALPDHALHAVDTPAGDPADLVAGGAGLVLEGVHRAEPLGGGPEDDGVLAAPAVGIAMDDLLAGQQSAGLLHILQDDRVGLLHHHPGVLAGIVGVAALIVHRHHHVHAVALAGLVVIRAEAGRGVDAAGTGIHGNIVGQHQTAGLGQEGMVRQHILKEGTLVGLHDLVIGDARHAHHLVGEGLSHNIHLAVAVVLHHGVALGGMQRDGQVAGQGPDGGGPDHEVQLGLVQMAQLALIVMHGELHIHGGAGIILILDLSLSQSGLVMVAPVHGLQALVDVALLVHLAKDLDLLGLKAGVHGLVGVFPVGHHAQALKALHLDADILFGIGVAGGAEVRHAHGLAVELLLLDDGALDGHTVVIPAGDIGCVPATHGVGPDDDVLQGLVQGVAHVEAAVGERRAVVKGEAGLTLVLLQQLVVEVHVLPALEHLRLPLGQTRPHGEVGLGQIDGLVVIHDASPFIL